MIFERDFDTTLPSENDVRNSSYVSAVSELLSAVAGRTRGVVTILREHRRNGVGRPWSDNFMFQLISRTMYVFFVWSYSSIIFILFAAGILSKIVQSIYAVRPVSSRHAESIILEGLLDKWYIELPEHLRYDPGSTKHPIPPPHILTLHMQYWCAVLLLHRPL